MLATLIALSALFQQGSAQAPVVAAVTPPSNTQTVAPNPGDLVYKMMEHYLHAQTVSGHIEIAQTADGVTDRTNIELDFIRPNRIYLHQVRGGNMGGDKLLIGNGTVFGYDRPPGVKGPDRFIEPTRTRSLDLLDIGGMYLAAQDSLLSLNPIQDIAIGRKDDLVSFRDHVATLKFERTSKLGDQDVNVLTGDWRMTKTMPVSGKFEMDITPDGDFRRFTLSERVAVPGHPEMAPIQVVTVYDGALKTDATVDEKIFQRVH